MHFVACNIGKWQHFDHLNSEFKNMHYMTFEMTKCILNFQQIIERKAFEILIFPKRQGGWHTFFQDLITGETLINREGGIFHEINKRGGS